MSYRYRYHNHLSLSLAIYTQHIDKLATAESTLRKQTSAAISIVSTNNVIGINFGFCMPALCSLDILVTARQFK